MSPSDGIAPVAAVVLEQAGYDHAARLMRRWQPILSDEVAERCRALEMWLSWIEGARDASARHAPHEVELLERAYDAVELELDALQREVRRAG